MCRRVLSLGTALAVIGGLCIASSSAVAAENSNPNTAMRPTLTTSDLGSQGLPLITRGGGGDELYAGIPTCTPNTNDNAVGIQGAGEQLCGDGGWVSMGYPVLTGGATIESVNVIFTAANTDDEGDLYLMGDCGNGPDINNILFAGCGCVNNADDGAVTNFLIGEPIVDAPATVWVVLVYRNIVTPPDFFIAFDTNQQAPNHGFGNLVGTGNCGDWTDLNEFGFGGCAWVSLITAAAPGVPECCDSPALCDGDVNGDGVVDPLDGGFILARFGLDASDPANCQADANCDGVIDPLDSGYVLARFGLCNPPCACPLGGGACDECGGGPGGGESCAVAPTADCCEVHSEPGCNAVCGTEDDGGVEACVCVVDDFCCTVTWDSACVEIVELFSCADCSENNPDCVEDSVCPGDGDCCVANGSVACDDAECCELICGADPFCCDTEWDQICADAAIVSCAICAGLECDPPCAPDEVCIGGECIPGAANDNCEDASVDALASGGLNTYAGDLTGATQTCDALGAAGETWHAFVSSTTLNVHTSFCGTVPVFGNAFIVIDTDCPCSGAFIFADSFDQATCADGNWTINYPSLPAGDYWTPVILDPAAGNDGPYVWNISAD